MSRNELLGAALLILRTGEGGQWSRALRNALIARNALSAYASRHPAASLFIILMLQRRKSRRTGG